MRVGAAVHTIEPDRRRDEERHTDPEREQRAAQDLGVVSVEIEDGWYHDLWYPGYCWAETPRSWRPVGLIAQGDSNTHVLDLPARADAADGLATVERAAGQWRLASRLTPFSTLEGRGFPVVLSFLADDRPATSSLEPELVAERLASAYGSEGP